MLWVRHGQTAPNVAGRMLGRLDPPLTEIGRDQVAAIVGVVAQAQPVRILTSPLARARETAAILGEGCGGIPIVVDERAVELDYGDWDGHRLEELPPGELARWRADATFRPPRGESLADVGRRVADLCVEWSAGPSAATANLVVVSHVSPIKAAVCWALDVDQSSSWRMHVALASVTRIGERAGMPFLAGFNEVRSGAEHRPA
jgi:probable phosphoglycerate mutase